MNKMSAPTKKSHHIRSEVCDTRAKYREGRDPKAIKVYTINLESRYLLIQGVPALGAEQDLLKLLSVYGPIQEHRVLHEYPSEQFTEVYLVAFRNIQSARFAKKKLDDFSFYGGVLHICYAPEYESIEDTRNKLQERRKAVAKRIHELDEEHVKTKKWTKAKSLPSTEHNNTPSLEESTEQNDHKPSPSDIVASKSQPTAHNHDVQASQPGQRLPYPMSVTDNTSQLTHPGPVWIPPPHLPPPPRHLPTWQRPPLPPQFDHARVPSSHSSLPPWIQEQGPWHRPPGPRIQGHGPRHHSGLGHGPRQQNPSGRNHDTIPQPSTGICGRTTNKASVSTAETKHFPGKFLPRTLQNKVPKSSQENTLEGGDKLQTSSETPIIRDYQVKGPKPSFVPRQVTAKTQIPNQVTSERKLEFRRTIRDAVNERLRQNAFILDNVKGPQLPEAMERKRKLFKSSDTGNSSMDDTIHNIREKVQQFSSTLPVSNAKKKKT